MKLPIAVLVASFVCVAYATEKPIKIEGVKSGEAILRQQGRLTVLEIKSAGAAMHRVALTHPSDYRQGTNGPIEAKLIAESPKHFLIFTDRFDSNPANPQGRCGASEGERYLHVVALETIPHETLSTLTESCLLDLVPTTSSPAWIESHDSAGFVGKITISWESGASRTYFVAPDGQVTRPEILPAISVQSRGSDSAHQGSGKFCVKTRFGSCRVVHGRYGIYVENNGIWDIRSKKLLTTAGDGELDEMIYAAGAAYDHEILGDFTVCPRSEIFNPSTSRTRASQEVCVQSFTATKIVKRRE